MSADYSQQLTYLVEPSPIFSTINYMTNIAAAPAAPPAPAAAHVDADVDNYNDTDNDNDALFEIDDVDTPLYSSSCHSVPSLMADTNLSDDDDDLFEVEDDDNNNNHNNDNDIDDTITKHYQRQTSWNPTLLSPLLQPQQLHHQTKKSSLSFDSVLIHSPPTRNNSSVTEQNYKIWLSSN